MNEEEIRRSWDQVTARLARRVNLGWWLQRWLPILLVISLLSAVALLGLRSMGITPVHWLWIGFACAVAGSVIAAWWLARQRFEDIPSARVRLEEALGLHSRLSAAASGIGAWPAPPSKDTPMPVSWRWQRPAGTLAASASLLLLASFMPVPGREPPKPHIIEKPTAVKQVEQWVEELRKEEAVSPESLAEVAQKMEELLKRPNDQWYEHASLEAADHLRDATGKALQELGSQLEQSQAGLTTLAELGNQLSKEEKQALAKQAQNNLSGLRSGAMKASESLADQLKKMDPKALQGMSKEQMQKLAERMKQNADALRKALANAPQYSFKECKGGNCQKPGKGGVNRGKGDAELTVRQEETNLGTKRAENLDSMVDPERVTPGDLLELQDARPNIDPNAYAGIKAGGSLQSAGDGGAAVEKATLVPAERAVLKRFFK